MEAGAEPQVSEAQIAVHWREEEYYQPPASFIGQANASDPVLTRLDEAQRGTLVARADDGGLRFDIVLQGPGQTTFFAV